MEVFVVGAARSGTTLLQMMLSAHPAIAIAGEIHYFDQIKQIEKTLARLDVPAGISRFFEALERCPAYRFYAGMEVSLATTRARLERDPAPDYDKFYRYLIEAYGTQHGARWFGEKTPSNIRYLQELDALFPDCRIVHIVRDPRASVLSRKKYPFTSQSVIFNTLLWKIELLYAEDFKVRCASWQRRFLEVRYEDLVADPENVLRRICLFLDEIYDSKMLSYHEAASTQIRDEQWKDGVAKAVYASSLDAWREEFTPAEILIIEGLTGSLMDEHQYRRSRRTVGAWSALPWTVARDIVRYGTYRLAPSKDPTGTASPIASDSSKLLRMLPKALLSC